MGGSVSLSANNAFWATYFFPYLTNVVFLKKITIPKSNRAYWSKLSILITSLCPLADQNHPTPSSGTFASFFCTGSWCITNKRTVAQAIGEEREGETQQRKVAPPPLLFLRRRGRERGRQFPIRLT